MVVNNKGVMVVTNCGFYVVNNTAVEVVSCLHVPGCFHPRIKLSREKLMTATPEKRIRHLKSEVYRGLVRDV